MNIKLVELRLSNFMGGTVTIRPNGENISVLGDNRAGKTRLADAHSWLFTGKNIYNSADFEVKNLDAYNNPIHGLEHSVEEIWDIDGKQVSFMRVWKESWVKKRGTNETEFKGHTTDFYIDNVPLAEKEFNARVESYFPLRWFQILTNPLYFVQYLKGDAKRQDWNIRRETLVSLFGEVSDDDIINANPKLSSLPGILAGRKFDDVKTAIKTSMSKTNESIQGIPLQIQENNRLIQSLSLEGLNLTNLTAERDSTQRVINTKGQEIEKIKNGGAIKEKRLEFEKIDIDIMILEGAWKENTESRISGVKKQSADLETQIYRLNQDIQNKGSLLLTKQTQINSKETEKSNLTKSWYAEKQARDDKQTDLEILNKKEFTFEPSGICPSCGAIPENQPNFSEEKAREEFNLKKGQGLQELQEKIQERQSNMDTITERGKAINKEIEALQGEIKTIKDEVKSIEDKAAELEAQKKTLDESISTEREKKIDTAEYKDKLQAKSDLEAKIKQLETDSTPTIQAIEEEVVKLRLTLQDVNSNIAKFDTKKTTENRIKELSEQEKKLAVEYEKLQSQLFLIEEFTRLKISSLEEKINSQFQIVRWKMFENQINGGIAECCDAMVNGVTVSGLNTEARVNAGLDIIDAFSRKLNLYLPVFVDNAEGVTKLLLVESQVVRLVKPEIETEDDRRKYSKLVIKNSKGEEI